MRKKTSEGQSQASIPQRSDSHTCNRSKYRYAPTQAAEPASGGNNHHARNPRGRGPVDLIQFDAQISHDLGQDQRGIEASMAM